MKKIKILFALFSIALAHAQAPTTAPPTPPVRTASDVISIYGEAYTNVPGVNINPRWGNQTAVTEETIAGNKVLKYANFDFQGTDFGANHQNISTMEYLHIDIWTNDQAVNAFVISPPANDGIPTLISSVAGSWQSLDIPVKAGMAPNLNDIFQFKFDATPRNGKTIYLDNLYFYKTAVAAGTDATLSNLKVGGTTVTGFSPTTTSYNVKLIEGTAIPTITATTNDAGANAVITNPTAIPGAATIVVTSQGGSVTKTYTVNYTYVPANTECAGTDTIVVDGTPLTLGYNYSFTTTGTDVTMTFELLDTKNGLVAYSFRRSAPGFKETGMTPAGGRKFTQTITGQTIGSTITYACKFAYEGGMSVTKDLSYTVGNKCLPADTTPPTGLVVDKGAVTPTTVELLLKSNDASGPITYNVTYGALTATIDGDSGVQKSLVITGLNPATSYNFSVTATDKATTPNTSAAVVLPVTTDVATDNQAPTGFTATVVGGTITSNSIELALNATDDSAGTITYHVTGGKVTSTTSPSGTATSLVITGLTYSTLYNFSVTASDATGNTTIAIPLSATTAPDTQVPTDFTATVGAITSNSVELLLKATDDFAGTITYNVTGDNTTSTTSASGVQKSLIISGLNPATAYSFNVTASDASGNATTATVLNATTDPLNTACAGKDTTANFTTGYTYSFKTLSSTSVEVTFVVLDTTGSVVGVNGQVQVNGGGFQGLTRTGNTYKTTVTVTAGQACTFMGYFPYPGNAAATKTYPYTVGDDCIPDTTAPADFTAIAGAITPTSVELLLKSTDASGPITYDVTYDGIKTATIQEVSGTQKSLIINDLTPETKYTFSVTAKDKKGNTTDAVQFDATTIAVPDTEAPADFTATAGVKTATSVELVLNSTDASGPIIYNVTYGAGLTATTTGVSGTQKSLVIYGLTPETAYNFSVTAKDAKGNTATSPQVSETTAALKAGTTIPVITSARLEKNDNPMVFVFFTINKDIDVNDPNADVRVRYLIKDTNGQYKEILEKNKGWSKYLSNEGDNTIRYCKGTVGQADYCPTCPTVIPAGQSVSTSDNKRLWQTPGYLDNFKEVITVIDSDGNSTVKELVYDKTAPTDFTAEAGTVTDTTVELKLNSTDVSGPITYEVTYDGGKTATTTEVSGTQKSLIITGLTPATAYNFSVTAKDDQGNTTTPKTVDATTPDTQAPADFTATLGFITDTTVQLLVKSTDVSGPITYTVTYGQGVTATRTEVSGIQKSFIISGLTPQTEYTFSVTAKDAKGNTTNPAVEVSATTIATPDTSTQIVTSAVLRHNTNPQLFVDFTINKEIDLTFSPTSVADVIISYQIKDADGQYNEVLRKYKAWDGYLNTYEGAVATKYPKGYAVKPDYVEVIPAGKTISTSDSKKAWQKEGYLANLKVVLTVIDNAGNTNIKELFIDEAAPADFTAKAGAITDTTVELLLNSTDVSGPITYTVTYGAGSTATTTEVSGTQKSLIISDLTPVTDYTFSVTAKDLLGNTTTLKTVDATTTDTQAPADFSATAGEITTTSVELLLNSTDISGPITYEVTYGEGLTETTTEVSGTQTSLIISDLTPGMAYTFSVVAKDAKGNKTAPVIVNKTTIALPDTQAPADFTAIANTITPTSVELLLNSTDASGPITYEVTYDGVKTATITEVSGTQTSLVIDGLTPGTEYHFSVIAKDAKENITITPIVVKATTTVATTDPDTNTECAGTSSETTEADKLALGYNYSFVTNETDVTVTFELLDTKVGLVAFSRAQTTTGFDEVPMTPAGGQKFTQTITGLTVGSQITYACKFAYSGGMTVTKYFTYTVGNNCGTMSNHTNDLSKSVTVYPNPARDILYVDSSSSISRIEFYSSLGNKVLESEVNNNSINIETLPSGVYMLRMYTENNELVIKKLIVE